LHYKRIVMRTSSVEQVILEKLAVNNTHLTSLQIYELLRERFPALNQSTVYRALERMAKDGRISVSDMGTGSSVYEGVSHDHHHHLVCQRCGAILTIQDDEVRRFFSGLQDHYGFTIATNHLVLFGTCERCLAKKPR
jgi:Fur family transcriptional regulator, ferric uptake regulator